MLSYVYYFFFEEKLMIQMKKLEKSSEMKNLLFEKVNLSEMSWIKNDQKSIFISDAIEACQLAKAKRVPVIMLENMDNTSDSYMGIRYVAQSMEAISREYLNEVFCRTHKLPIEILKTNRCNIREIDINDLDRLYEIYSDPETSQFTETLFEDREEELAYIESYIENIYSFYGFGMWIAEDRETGKIIGRAGLEYKEDMPGALELGYIICKTHRKKGYAYEICSAIIDYAYNNLEYAQIYSVIHPENKASIALCSKLGFSSDGEYVINGQYYKKYKKMFNKL